MKRLEMRALFTKRSRSRFRNTFCKFQATFKVPLNQFCSNIDLDHTHNHPINSLEALSFKMLTEEVKNKVLSLLATGLTPSQAHK